MAMAGVLRDHRHSSGCGNPVVAGKSSPSCAGARGREAGGNAVAVGTDTAASPQVSAEQTATVEMDRVRFAWRPDHRDVLDIARFEVAAGERVFIEGPSGSGKSTLFSLLGGVLSPREGTVRILRAGISEMPARRREMAVLRSVGARPLHVFALFMSEAGVLALLGAAAGVALLYVALLIGQPIVARAFGLHMPIAIPSPADWWIIGAVVLAGFAAGGVPAVRAYRLSLADGLSMRI